MPRLRVALAHFFATACLAAPCGDLGGFVRDPSGAGIGRAAVTAALSERREKRETRTAPDGSFEFVDLSCGEWSIQAEADGFRRTAASGLLLRVGQTLRADLALEIGVRSETVEVRAAAEEVSPAPADVTERAAVAAMPLNARQYLDLAMLSPGLVPAPPGTQGSGFNAGGIRSQSNVYLLDGASVTDMQTNQPLNLFRLTDAVEEFDVETGPRPASEGRGSGGRVNVVTKSGTSVFHGSLFEYLRNTQLNAADFFTNKLGGSKGALNRNQFGASAGGPLPGRRTFFFVSWEEFRQVSATVSATLVPTGAQRASVTDPISQRLLAYWPTPNAAGTTNFISNVANRDSDDTALVKVDRVAGRDRLSVRWTEYWGSSEAAGATALSGGGGGPLGQVSAMADDVHTFSPSATNDLRAGYSRNAVTRSPQDAGLNAASIFTDAAGRPLAGVVDAATNALNSGLPSISVGGGFAALGANANFPQGRVSNTTELFDDATIFGRRLGAAHKAQFGVHARREDLSRYLNRAERGTISFSNFADFARGQINTSTFRSGDTQSYWRRYPWAAYAQDEIRLRENLTVTLGVRYEYPSASSERGGVAVNFVPGYGPMVAGSDRIVAIDPAKKGPASIVYRTAPFTLPASGVYPDRTDVSPEAGFAWTPRALGVTVRGGFRLAYDDLFDNVTSAMALNPPWSLQTTQTANVTQPGKFGWAAAFDQNVSLVSNYGAQGPGTPTVGTLTFQGLDTHMRSAYAMLYDLTLERRLGRNLSVDAGINASQGRRLGIFLDANQPTVAVRDPTRRGNVAPNEQIFPYNQFGQAQVAEPAGNSNYGGATARLLYSAHGVYTHVAYTAGKSLDYNSSYFGSGNLPGETGAPIDSRNLRLEHGPSAFDVRERLVAAFVAESPARGRVAGGWRIAGIVTAQSGIPFTVVNGGQDWSGFNQANSGISPQGGNRPNLTKAGPLPQSNGNPDAAFDTTWFAPALAGQDGTSGRNQYHGPGLANVDVSLSRSFAARGRFGEKVRLQFSADFFNALNHTNFANPVADLNNLSFGKITQTLGSAVATSAGTSGGATGGPRLIQLSLRLLF